MKNIVHDKKNNLGKLVLVIVAIMALAGTVHAFQDIGSPDTEAIKRLYPGKTYSPYAKRSFPSQVYWGDTHLHTALSPDAGLFGNTLGLDQAYRFARGEEVTSSTGLPARLSRPLDWLVLTEHTDMMGFATDLIRGTPNLLAIPKTREWIEGLQKGGDAATAAALDLITTFSQLKVPKEAVKDYSPGSPIFEGVWNRIIEAAETYNEPGRFTAFIGYEWTSVPQGNNLHRNIVLRDNGQRARQLAPMTTILPFGSTDPLDLYKWLENYEAKTGGRVFALAHNGNLSNGWMFPTDKTYAGGKVNKNYVDQRAKWEPLYEIITN